MTKTTFTVSVTVGVRVAWWLRPLMFAMRTAARLGVKWSDKDVETVARKALSVYVA